MDQADRNLGDLLHLLAVVGGPEEIKAVKTLVLYRLSLYAAREQLAIKVASYGPDHPLERRHALRLLYPS